MKYIFADIVLNKEHGIYSDLSYSEGTFYFYENEYYFTYCLN